MNTVDSSGWLEYFGNGLNAEIFAPAIKATDSLVVPTICIYEVFKRVCIEIDEEEALKAVGVMSLGRMIELTREIVISAAVLSLELKLLMADSIILATSRYYQATLWTQGEDVLNLKGVKYIAKVHS
jgi:predicted nucleic acid-binding protein